MGQIVQSMMTLPQLQKNKYECTPYSLEVPVSSSSSSSSNSSNSDDKLSANSIEYIEEQAQHTSSNDTNISLSTNLKENNKDIHSVSENLIPAILPKRPWGEFSLLHFTDTSSNIYSSLSGMIHSLHIGNGDYSTPNTSPSSTNEIPPAYTIPQESILSESDDDDDHQDYDDTIAMDDIIKIMQETHLHVGNSLPSLCKSSSPSSAIENKGYDNSNATSTKNSATLDSISTINYNTMIPSTTVVNNNNNNNNNSNPHYHYRHSFKTNTTHSSKLLPSDFQFSFHVEKGKSKNEQPVLPPSPLHHQQQHQHQQSQPSPLQQQQQHEKTSSPVISNTASPFTLKYRKILPLPKSRIKRVYKDDNKNNNNSESLSLVKATPSKIQMDQVNNDKSNFLNKQSQQPQPQHQHSFITLSSVNNEEDSIYDHTKKVKRMNHQPPISEKPINLVFKETLNKEFTLNVNPPPIPLVPLSSLDKPQNNNNEPKKKVIPPIATTFSINNYNHKFSNNNNNTLLYPSTSQSQPLHSSSSSQSSSQSTKKNNTKADTHLSSNNTNKNKSRGKSYNKPNSTKKKSNKPLTEGGSKRIRQRQQQQQQDPFSTNLITPLDATADWVCLFCQYEIFMNGWIATQKKKRSAQKRKVKRMRNKSKQQQNEECDECETISSATCESEYEH